MQTIERREFEDLCRELGVWAKWDSSHGFHRSPEGWEHQLFRVSWGVGVETLGTNIPYRRGMAFEDDPSGSEILGSILMDAGTAAPYRGVPLEDAWLQSADELGYFGEGADIERIKSAREAFRTCRAWDDLLRERVGEEEANMLIDAAQQL